MKVEVKVFTNNVIEVDDNLNDDEIEEIVDKWILRNSYWSIIDESELNLEHQRSVLSDYK